jgi:xanthine dehydrogenase accessory factor
MDLSQMSGDPGLIPKGASDAASLFIDPIDNNNEVIFFGGGHISTCLSPLLKTLDFSTVVVDGRHEYANAQQFPEADHIHVVSFKEAFSHLRITASSYIVIATCGHVHDKEVLAGRLRHPAAYIGMIGSRRKTGYYLRCTFGRGIF